MVFEWKSFLQNKFFLFLVAVVESGIALNAYLKLQPDFSALLALIILFSLGLWTGYRMSFPPAKTAFKKPEKQLATPVALQNVLLAVGVYLPILLFLIACFLGLLNDLWNTLVGKIPLNDLPGKIVSDAVHNISVGWILFELLSLLIAIIVVPFFIGFFLGKTVQNQSLGKT